MKKKTILVGVTGGMGSGKSLVCKIFQTLGVPVYFSDVAAKEIMQNNLELKKNIQNNFGKDAYHPSGEVNKKYLSEILFKNKQKLELMNALVHPLVAMDFNKWTQKNIQNDYIVKESALLLQTEEYKYFDFILYVSAPEALRIERIQKRDPQRTKEEIHSIIQKQIPEEKVIKKATHRILNDDKTLLIPQIITLHKEWKSALFRNETIP